MKIGTAMVSMTPDMMVMSILRENGVNTLKRDSNDVIKVS